MSKSKDKDWPDYRKELEKAAKQMVLVHRVDVLIKLILRTIERNLKIKHVGLFLYDQEKNEYVAKVSRGKGGLKIPSGLIKVSEDNPLIKFFTDAKFKIFAGDFLFLDKINGFLALPKDDLDKDVRKLFENIKFQFLLYNIESCVPGFFRDKLIYLLLLGKKVNRKKITSEELGFLSVLSSDAVMAIQNAWVFQDLNKQLQANRILLLQTAVAFANAIEAKDKYTSGHTDRVSHYSLVVAEELSLRQRDIKYDWGNFIESLRIASLLHDIGKIGVKEKILNKKSKLTKNEWEEIKAHPLMGFTILKQIDEFREAILGIKYHHERNDGKGYPEGLKGPKIPLIAKIISVVDAFDAMTTNRPYRKKIPKKRVIEMIENDRGKQFSPLVVDAFLRACKKGKI